MKAKFAQHPRFTVSLFGILALALVAFLASCDSREETPIAAATATVQASNDMQLAGEFVQAQSGIFYCQKNESAAGFDLSCQAVDTPASTAEPPEEATPTIAPAGTATATPRVRGTATSTPALPTTEPTVLPSPTVEMTGTATVEPTGTAAPTAVATVTPGVTLTPSAHNVNEWHPPMLGHHHGPPYTDAHPQIVEWIETHPWGQYFAGIGMFDPSNEVENLYPFPPGKHEGHKNVIEIGMYDQKGAGVDPGVDLCVDSAFLKIHSLATGEAFRTPNSIHSVSLIITVDNDCNPNTPLPDDSILAFAGHGFYGERHARYKNTLCDADLPPVYPGSQSVNQPPYVTVNTSSREWNFWSTLTNSLMQQFYEPDVNTLVQLSWAERVWESPSLNDCGNPEADVAFCPADGACGANGTRFQIHSIIINDLDDYPTPYAGFIDRYGADNNHMCSAVGANCFPFYRGAGVPDGTVFLSRLSHIGDPNDAPFLDYATNADLVMPGYEGGH